MLNVRAPSKLRLRLFLLVSIFLLIVLGCDSPDDSDGRDNIVIDDDDDDDDNDDDNDDRPDDDDDDDDDDDEPCEDNRPPVIREIIYKINGTPVSAPILVQADDLLEVLPDYADPDCNLPGGFFWFSLDDEPFERLNEPLPDSLGCSFSDSGVEYGFAVSRPMLLGSHVFKLYWTDNCAEKSNVVEGAWTVKP